MKPLQLARSYNFARMARCQEGTVIQIEAAEKGSFDLETRSVRADSASVVEPLIWARLASKEVVGPGSRLQVDWPGTRWLTRASPTTWRPQSSSTFEPARHRRYCHSVGSRPNPLHLFSGAIPA